MRALFVIIIVVILAFLVYDGVEAKKYVELGWEREAELFNWTVGIEKELFWGFTLLGELTTETRGFQFYGLDGRIGGFGVVSVKYNYGLEWEVYKLDGVILWFDRYCKHYFETASWMGSDYADLEVGIRYEW